MGSWAQPPPCPFWGTDPLAAERGGAGQPGTGATGWARSGNTQGMPLAGGQAGPQSVFVSGGVQGGWTGWRGAAPFGVPLRSINPSSGCVHTSVLGLPLRPPVHH